MKYAYTTLWAATLLLAAWTLGVRHGERMPVRYPTMPAVHPMSDWGCDNPDMRLYMYGLNPNVEFAYGITEKPHLVGLEYNAGRYRIWDQ